MVAGSLQVKNGKFYMVLSYKDATGKPKTKWKSTGLAIKGNKKEAETMLMKERLNFKPIKTISEGDILFCDFMKVWLEMVKPNIEITTHQSYANGINARIFPYFSKKQIKLSKLKPKDIQDFYTYCMDEEKGYGVSANTVIHYHANIHSAMKYAHKVDLIQTNPMLKVDRPRKQKFVGGYYDRKEMCLLFDAVRGTNMELPIVLAGFYGLRRSELLGLKWNAVDFENKTISILHTVTELSIDGTFQMIARNNTKTPASRRTLPLVPIVEKLLTKAREEQKEHRRVCGNCYNKEYLGYIVVDEMGNLRRPNYISENFKKILNKNNFRKIRFHDLRHSCASLLLANGVNMKNIQEWLGHSNFSTTADVYSHLDFNNKISSANIMHEVLSKKKQ